MDTVLKVLYVLTYPVTLSVYLAQMPVMLEMGRARSTTGYSALPTLAALANCCLWASYGAYTGAGSSVMGVSIAGGLIQLFYLTCFLLWSGKEERVRLLAMVALETAGLAIFLGSIFTARPDSGQGILGAVATGGSIAMFSAPISSVLHALHAKDTSHVPVLLTCASLACSCLWGVYGLLLNDKFIAAPNVAGVLLSSIQLLVVAYILRGQQLAGAAAGKGDDAKPVVQAAALFTGAPSFLPLHELDVEHPSQEQVSVPVPVPPFCIAVPGCKGEGEGEQQGKTSGAADSASGAESLSLPCSLPVSPTVLSMPDAVTASLPSSLSTETLSLGVQAALEGSEGHMAAGMQGVMDEEREEKEPTIGVGLEGDA